MEEPLADRFVRTPAGWIDLASGAHVRIRVRTAAERRDQLAWNDRCATLARLRHPLIAPLVDYGLLDTTRTFEAHLALPPIRASGAAAVAALTHVARFLESHGLPLSRSSAPLVMRQLENGPPSRGRPIGVVLQPRRVLGEIDAALAAAAPGGVAALDVFGTRGSGLRTLIWTVSRAARCQGFVVVGSAVLSRWPWLAGDLLERHVVLLTSDRAAPGERRLSAALLMALGRSSARRHVVITFRRTVPTAGGPGLQVERMGVARMEGMIYRDPECGPSSIEIADAARAACGNPGALLEHLRALRVEPHLVRPMHVHESSPEYEVRPAPDVVRPPGRLGKTLRGAAERGARLAAGGRHAAAARLLRRATRVLAGRGASAAAAECALTLGWLQRERNKGDDALAEFERARQLGGDGPVALSAAIATGVVWTDELRLPESESLLRSTWAAASLLHDLRAKQGAAMALARCLLWQERYDEAAATLDLPSDGVTVDVELDALAARIFLGRGEHARAARAASAALHHSAGASDPRLVATAARAMALVRVAIQDAGGAADAIRTGLRAAAAARRPLYALRLRLIAHSGAEVVQTNTHAGGSSQRLDVDRLPPLLKRQVEHARPASRRETELPAAASFDMLRDLLERAQAARDDGAALEAVCEKVCERLGAAAVAVIREADPPVVSRAGRAWTGDWVLARRALATGLSVASAPEPFEHAAPIRYGADVIGALTCRWLAGSRVDRQRAAAACEAAALACAVWMRSLLDRSSAPPLDPDWQDLLGASPGAACLRDAIVRASRAPFPVLIEGESGTGKELVARAIHRLSTRRPRRLCTINCAALSDELVEAELFGHTRGAFTGAVAERAGLFEEADGGSLFLDEIGELSGRAQAKLLRVLQDGEVRRVGENLPRRVDTRVIAATNRCLEQEVAAGRFRADLRFRLDVIRIVVPALRDRSTDIPILASHFWQEAAMRLGSRATLAPETLAALARYDWPGNIRELQNAVSALAVQAPRRGRVTPEQLPSQLARVASIEGTSFEAARLEFERRYVRAALARAGGQRTRAARALGVTRQGLAKMLRRLDIAAADSPDAN